MGFAGFVLEASCELGTRQQQEIPMKSAPGVLVGMPNDTFAVAIVVDPSVVAIEDPCDLEKGPTDDTCPSHKPLDTTPALAT